MNTAQSALYERLQRFQFDEDDAAAMTFADRLGRENGWSPAFTRRVIEEYRRFLLLAATAGHPVTPSDAVDQAWHLHLVYTRSYWGALCSETLGWPLHHGPTRGGRSERDKFADWYGRTLQTYREAFGQEPPSDIWPTVQDRFTDQSFVRVDRRSHWLVSKAAIARWSAVAALAVTVSLAGVSCTSGTGNGQAIVWVGVAAAVIAIIVGSLIYGRGKGGNGGGCGIACGTGHDGGGGCASGCGGGGGCGGGCGGD